MVCVLELSYGGSLLRCPAAATVLFIYVLRSALGEEVMARAKIAGQRQRRITNLTCLLRRQLRWETTRHLSTTKLSLELPSPLRSSCRKHRPRRHIRRYYHHAQDGQTHHQDRPEQGERGHSRFSSLFAAPQTPLMCHCSIALLCQIFQVDAAESDTVSLGWTTTQHPRSSWHRFVYAIGVNVYRSVILRARSTSRKVSP